MAQSNENETIVKTWNKLTTEWGLKSPELLISVTGGAKKYIRKPHLDEVLKRGLANVAINTNAWIITGGTATGIMQLVGEAVESHTESQQLNQERELTALGIATWGFVAQKDKLKDVEVQDHKDVEHQIPAQYELKSTRESDKDAPLDPNHTHFILVDDGTEGKPGKEIQFRSELEKHICEKKEVPSVLIVVDGGPQTLETVKETLNRDIPVVVIAGSGRAADCIANCYAYVSSFNRKENLAEHMNPQRKEIVQTCLFPDGEAKKAQQLTGEIMQKWKLLTIFNADTQGSADLEKELKNAVLSALKKEDTDTQLLTQLLTLAIKWHCWEFAEEKLLTPENKGNWKDLNGFLLTALQENQVKFVQYFLDLGADLETFLADKTRLNDLLKREKNKEEMHDLLDTLAPDGVNATTVNKILVKLMRDENFNCYSETTEEANPATQEVADGASSIKGWVEKKDPERKLFLWAVLLDRNDLAKLFWRRGREHLGRALLASALLTELSALAETNNHNYLSVDLRKHSEEWENRAYDVLTECYLNNQYLTHHLLVRELFDSKSATSNAICPIDFFSKNPKQGLPTLLIMAESHKMMHFIEHQSCQDKLNAIWKGKMAPDTSHTLIFLCIFLPAFLPFIRLRDGKNEEVCPLSAQEPKHKKGFPLDFVCKLHTFYTAPVTKFLANIVAYLVFLFIISYFTMVELTEKSPSILEYITWVWLLTMILEEFRQMLFRHHLSLGFRVRKWFSSVWNQLDVSMYLFFVISVFLRDLLPYYGGDFKWARAFYSIALVLSYLRSLQYFYAVKSMGPKIIMIKKMMGDMFLFIAVLVVFVLGFGIAYQVNMFPSSPPDWNILFNIIYYPYFQIYGELFLSNFRGEADDCTDDEAIWRHDTFKRCPSDSRYISYLMVGFYLIVTNVLLVNLLIAMFSYTFQKVQEQSLKVWHFYLVSLVHEYFDRPALVPPLIFLNHIYRMIRWICVSNKVGDICHTDTKETHKCYGFRRTYKPKEQRRLDVFEKSGVEKYFSRFPSGLSGTPDPKGPRDAEREHAIQPES